MNKRRPRSQRAAAKAAPKSRQHDAALKYADDGFLVLPIWPNEKRPLTAHGYLDATTNVQQINQWWTRCPDANVAIHTKDLLVLDLDVKNGVDGIEALYDLEDENDFLPDTREQETPSGGRHLIFRTSGVTVPSVTNCPKPGIDVRASGGYILVSPSMINGVEYFQDDNEIADAPDWLIDMILNRETGHGDEYNEDSYTTEELGLVRLSVHLKRAGDSVRISSRGQEMTVTHDPMTMAFLVK